MLQIGRDSGRYAFRLEGIVARYLLTAWEEHCRGYHTYIDLWTNPSIGEVLLLKREPDNVKHQFAFAVIRDGGSRRQCNLAPTVSQFLREDCNKAFVEVSGDKVNRGARYGGEIPCVYRFYGPEPYTNGSKKLQLLCKPADCCSAAS